MELTVIALAAIVLLAVFVGAVALVRRAMEGRELEERFRVRGDLEPIQLARRQRRAAAPMRRAA